MSLAIVGDDIFWSSSKSTKLNWTPKQLYFGTKSMHIEHPFAVSSPSNMELISIKAPIVSNHPCAKSELNGGCSHICIAMGKTMQSCLCPIGTVYGNALNTTCIPIEKCYFRCETGECITKSQQCDGIKDCPDFSDETNCHDKQDYVTCTPDQFTCFDKLKCIDHKLRFFLFFSFCFSIFLFII